jgi:nicotinamidase-related amidase
MTNRALLVVDMQNGFCHPDGSFPRIGLDHTPVSA